MSAGRGGCASLGDRPSRRPDPTPRPPGPVPPEVDQLVPSHRADRASRSSRSPRSHLSRSARTHVLVSAPLAVVATLGAVAAGVVLTEEEPTAAVAEPRAGSVRTDAAGPEPRVRDEPVTRGGAERGSREHPTAAERASWREAQRERATRRAVAAATEHRWTTAALDLWTTSGAAARQVGGLDEGTKVLVTGRRANDRDEVVVDGVARWVTTGYLTAEEPAASDALGTSCDNGADIARPVDAAVEAVFAAVCTAFPEITSYGTLRDDGEHSQGLALDVMVSGARGWEVAEFVRDHSAELGVAYVIFDQRIWSTDRAGEGWRPMEDRGSATANHVDHVHVTVG